MPYKISGELSEDARIIVINESDWSIDSNTQESLGTFEITVSEGQKTIIGRTNNGLTKGYGGVTPEQIGPTPLDRGITPGAASNDTNTLEYITISSAGNSTLFGNITGTEEGHSMVSNGGYDKGLIMGAKNGTVNLTTIFHVTISTTGNATDWGGDLLTAGRAAGCSNNYNQRGVVAGGTGYLDSMEYVTINSVGNANDFGDLIQGDSSIRSCANGANNRGIFAGGRPAPGDVGYTNLIQYITISTTGNATDFGDLSANRRGMGVVSNGTNNRGVFMGGVEEGGIYVKTMEYITITSTGNVTDFGDRLTSKGYGTQMDNQVNERGVVGGGYTSTNQMEYITINTTGNSLYFGDLIWSGWYFPEGTSNA